MQADLVVLGTDPALGARGFTDVRYTIRAGKIIFEAAMPQGRSATTLLRSRPMPSISTS